MARNGARNNLQKKPEEKVCEEFTAASPSSSRSASIRRPWKLSGSVKRPAGEEEEEAPNTEEPNSKTSSSRHLLVLLRRHSAVLRHRPFNRRDIRSCCFCCFCCCSCTCIDSVSQRSVPPSMASGKESMVSSITSKKNYLDPKAELAPSTASTTEDRPCAEPLPSLEEIRSWGESFDRLMRCAAGRELFREFLQREYSEENILFWSACEDLKRECDPELIEEKARIIYENYVSILSPKEVSLDSKVRDIVNEKMNRPTAHTFDEAQLQIYTLMHRDSYPRFLGSSVYRRVAQLSPTSRKTSVSVH